MSKINRRLIQAVLAALLLVVAITVWVVLLPSQLGGQTVYVIVNGNSMEPKFHNGDLVITSRSSNYQVGDIVVYRSSELQSLVFHRIIGLDQDHFILKGDNNSWTDSYQPTKKELLGKLWLLIPHAGKVVIWLRTPLVLAIIVGALSVILGLTFMTSSKRKKTMTKRNRWEWLTPIRSFIVKKKLTQEQPNTEIRAAAANEEKPMPPGNNQYKGMGEMVEGSMFFLAFIALASSVLGIFAFTRPVWLDVSDNINFRQIGTYSYTATAPAGIYDTTVVTSGAPLFPKLTCMVNVQFVYTLLGDQLQDLVGSHQLTAIIQDDRSGWQRTLPLETQTVFNGNTFVTSSKLDLCQVESIVAGMEKETELSQSSYSLIINPRVAINGTMAGRKLQTTYEPHLLFLFDKVHFFLYKSDVVLDPLNSTQAGLVEGTRRQANALSLLGLTLAVGKARVFSVVGLGLSISGSLILGLFFYRKVRGNQEALVQMKYGSLLVDVRDRLGDQHLPPVDVFTMEDLVTIAERQSGVILHALHGLVNYYYVQGEKVLFRFVVNEGDEGLVESQPLYLSDNLRGGIERGEFRVYYQPIISLSDHKISAVEALLRWQHPERGLVSANQFIREAEQTGVIDQIGEWMLHIACTQLKEWQNAGLQLKLAVNFSTRQLEHKPAEMISSVFQNSGIDLHDLLIEIPEISLLEKKPVIIRNLRKMSNLGIQICADGFTSHSPVSKLEQYQIHCVKIDRSQISQVGNPDNAVTVSGMISSIHQLGISVVAVGVEAQGQLEFLQEQPAMLAQGFFLGRPAPAEEIRSILEKGRGVDYHKTSTE